MKDKIILGILFIITLILLVDMCFTTVPKGYSGSRYNCLEYKEVLDSIVKNAVNEAFEANNTEEWNE